MQKHANPLTDPRSLIIPLIVIIHLAIDLLSKEWVRMYPVGLTISQLGFIRITHIQNTGAAFGIFQGMSRLLMVVVSIGLVALVGLIFWVYRRLPQLVTVWNLVAISLIIGGTTGNLIDRIRFNGNVTDFIDPGFWPAFNAADSGITIGAIMLAISILRLALKEKR